MSDSYDDMFNDRLFGRGVHCTVKTRPGAWPKSVSEMRGYSYFGGQGVPEVNSEAFCDYMHRRPRGHWQRRPSGAWEWVSIN